MTAPERSTQDADARFVAWLRGYYYAPAYRPEEIGTLRTRASIDRILALLRRIEIALTRALDELWPHLEAALTGRSRVCRWYWFLMVGLLTILVTSQFVMWYRRCFVNG
jgi:hypothetical protein